MSYISNPKLFRILQNKSEDKMKEIRFWTKRYNNDGIPFYYCEGKASQWEHPGYEELLEEITPFNDIKYAAYRIAFKLDKIQKRIMFNEVALRNVVAGFDRAKLTTSANDDLLNVEGIELVLHNVYKTNYDKQAGYENDKYCLDIALNFIISVYDQGRSGNIQVLSLKVILVLLCCNDLTDKFIYLYNQVADHNNCISRKRLALLLKDVAQIAEFFSEIIPFGIPTVARAVDSCFAGLLPNASANEEQFTSWLAKEPESIVWYFSFFRLQSAQTVTHYIRCKQCKRKPISGFRYRCVQCLQSTFCQECFLYGLTKFNHDPTHPVKEFCHQVTKRETRSIMGEIFWNKIRKSKTCGLKTSCLEFSGVTPAHSTGSLLRDSLLQMTTDSLRPPPVPNEYRQETSFFLRPRTVSSSADLLLDVSDVDLTEKDVAGSKSEVKNDVLHNEHIDNILEQLQQDHRDLKEALSKAPNIPADIIGKRTAALDSEIHRLKTCLRESMRQANVKRNDLTSTRNDIPLSSGLTDNDESPNLFAISSISFQDQPSSVYDTSVTEGRSIVGAIATAENGSKKSLLHQDSDVYGYLDFFLHGLNDITPADLNGELEVTLSCVEINKFAAPEAIFIQKKLETEIDTLCLQLGEACNPDAADAISEPSFMTEFKNSIENLEQIGEIMLSGDDNDLDYISD